MITFTDILVLMLAYAALSLGTICLFWHLKKNVFEQRWQRQAGLHWVHRLPLQVVPSGASRNVRAAGNHSTFGRAMVLAAVLAAAVAFLAHRPALGTGSIAVSPGPPLSNPKSSYPQNDDRAANQLAIFLERWTSTGEPASNKK